MGIQTILLLSILVIHGSSTLRPKRITGGEWCLKEGVQPHPHNCRKFIICAKDDLGNFFADHYTCPYSQVFSITSASCVQANKIPSCIKTADSDEDCGNKLRNCKDCNTLVICQKIGDNDYQVIGSDTCSGDKQYCDADAVECTATLPPACFPHSKCTGEGIFPNVNNCTIYYECSANNGKLIDETKVCKHGYVFTPRTDCPDKQPDNPQCKKRKSPADCKTLKCRSGELKVQVLPWDPRYYVICTSKNEYFIYLCSKGIFDEKTKTCDENAKVPDIPC